MRTQPLTAALLLALAGCGKEPPAPPLPPPTGSAVAVDDSVRVQGTWLATGVRREEGKPDEVPNAYTLRFDGNNYTMTLEDSVERGTFRLTPGAAPKQIDLETQDGESRKGLYALDGDKLTVCVPDQTNAPRPAEIKATADAARVTVVVFTRSK